MLVGAGLRSMYLRGRGAVHCARVGVQALGTIVPLPALPTPTCREAQALAKCIIQAVTTGS